MVFKPLTHELFDIFLSYLSAQCLTTKEGSVDLDTHGPWEEQEESY